MGDPARRFEDLTATTERSRYDFLTTELKLSFTLARLVETEIGIGELEGAKRAIGKAELGFQTASRFLHDLKNDEQRHEIQSQLHQLRATLDGLHRKLE